jgi:hypothetical protein
LRPAVEVQGEPTTESETMAPVTQPTQIIEAASLTREESSNGIPPATPANETRNEAFTPPQKEISNKATEPANAAEQRKDSGTFEISKLKDEIKQQLQPLHSQFIEGLETEHENLLAQEIRQLYCQLSTIKRNQAVTLAQTNGILAALTLKLPTCSRLQGIGQSLLLQECKTRRANITAVETNCGFQPFYAYKDENYTIGMDGWSLHPYSNCFWKTHLVNLNGRTYSWEHNATVGDWTEQKPNIHTPNLNLIAEFSELPLKDYDFMVKNHPAHEVADLEQLNVLNDLMGRIQDAKSHSLSQIIMSEKQDNNIGTMFSWTKTLKIMVLSIIGFILGVICVRLFIEINPFPRLIQVIEEKRQQMRQMQDRAQAPAESLIPMVAAINPYTPVIPHTQLNLEASAPIRNINDPPTHRELNTALHSHTRCTYVVGRGLVWEDLCPCNTN